MKRLLVLIAFLLISALGALGQNSTSAQTFEVDSVKVRKSTERSSTDRVPSAPDSYIRNNVSLRQLLEYAFDLQRFEILSLPDWGADSIRFDIAAKASFAPSPLQMREMMQRLLMERFSLKTHKEKRVMSVYVLRLARNDGRLGPQLKKTSVNCADVKAQRLRQGAAQALGRPGEACTSFLLGTPSPSGVALRYQASGITGAELADWLAPHVERPVIDRTGLTGELDVDLRFLPGAPNATAAAPDAPTSVFTATQEQLGLRLESGKEAVEILVIDSVNLPSPN
jgi:uncharacterized protein (TIGR03435 family)